MGFLRRHDNGRVFNTDRGMPDSALFAKVSSQDNLRQQAATHNLYAGENLELRLMPGAVKVKNADLFYDSKKDGYKLVYDGKVLLWVDSARTTVQKVRPSDPLKEKAINEALVYLGLENEVIKGERSNVASLKSRKESEGEMISRMLGEYETLGEMIKGKPSNTMTKERQKRAQIGKQLYDMGFGHEVMRRDGTW